MRASMRVLRGRDHVVLSGWRPSLAMNNLGGALLLVMSSKPRKSTAKRFPRSLQSLPTAHELSELEKARQNEVAMKSKIRTVSFES